MVEKLGAGPGRGVTSGRSATRIYGNNNKYTQAQSMEDERLAMRWRMLELTGLQSFSDQYASIGLDLVRSPMDDQQIQNALAAAVETEAIPKMVKHMRGLTDDGQDAMYMSLAPATQKVLSSNGYVPPNLKADDDWWNPFDWDDIAGKAIKPISIPLQIAMAPFRYGLAPVVRGVWEGMEKSMRLGLRVQRSLAMQYEANLAKTSGGFKGHFSAMRSSNLTNFKENWKNAEFEKASFTNKAREGAQDLLDDEDYQILMGTLRHEGNFTKAATDYFKERAKAEGNPDPEGAGILGLHNWLDKGSVNTREWLTAAETLQRGSVEAGAMSVRQYDRTLRTLHLTALDNMRMPLTGWNVGNMGRTGAAVGGTLFSAVMFDPVTWGTLGYSAVIKGARIGLTAAGAAQHAVKIRSLYEMSSAHRAVRLLGRSEQTRENAKEIIVGLRTVKGKKTPEQLLKTKGRVKGVLKPKNLQKERNAYIDDFEPNWLGRTPFYLNRQLKHIEKNIEMIMDHFAAHDVWLKTNQLYNLNGMKNIDSIDPLIDLVSKQPKLNGLIEDLKRYHNAMKHSGMNVDDYDLMPAGLKVPAESVPLRVKQPGLDEWDGVWAYLQSENGLRALSATPFGRAGLAGRTEKFFFPRLTKASQMRINVRKGMNVFLDKAAYKMKEVHPLAFAQSVNTMRTVRQVGLVNNLFKRIHSVKGAADAFDFKNPASVKRLTPNDLMDVLESTASNVGHIAEQGGRGPSFNETKRILSQYDLTSGDLQILKDAFVRDVDLMTEQVYQAYQNLKNGIEPQGLDPDVVELVRNDLPQFSDFFTVHTDRFGVIRFDKEGRAIFPKTRGFMRGARQMTANRKSAIEGNAGSANASNALPNLIETLAQKTWDEIADEGIALTGANTPRFRMLQNAGYATPAQLIDAIETSGYRSVVSNLNKQSAANMGRKIKVADLKSFIKDQLGIVVKERQYYDSFGSITDKGLEVGYALLYHPVRLADKLTKMAPRKGHIDVASNDAVRDFKSLLDMGMKADMDRSVLDMYLSIFLNGTPAQRWDVQSHFLMDFLGRTGALVYGGSGIEKWMGRFIRQGAHHYSNFGQDLITSSVGRRNRAIVPGGAKEAQVSNLNVIPSWRELGEAARFMNMMSFLGYGGTNGKFGPAIWDRVIARYWRPLVLMRLGVGVRNAADEGLQFILREGPTAYANAKFAKYSLNRAKVYGPWGELMTQPVSAETRRSLLFRPLNRALRFALDSTAIGDASITKRAAMEAEKEIGHIWGMMDADKIIDAIKVKRLEIVKGQTAYRGLNARGRLNSLLGTNGRHLDDPKRFQYAGLMGIMEALSNRTARTLHAITPEILSKPKLAKGALKLLKSDADTMLLAVERQFLNPIVMNAAYEGLFGAYRSYYGQNHLSAIDEMLQLNSRGIGTTRGLLPYIKLQNNSRWDVISDVTAEGMQRSDALGQNILIYKNDPSMQTIGFAQSHFVDADVLTNTNRIVQGESGQSLLYELGKDARFEASEVTKMLAGDEVLTARIAYDMIEEIPHVKSTLQKYYNEVSSLMHGYSREAMITIPRINVSNGVAKPISVKAAEKMIAQTLARNSLESKFLYNVLSLLNRSNLDTYHPNTFAFLVGHSKDSTAFTNKIDDVIQKGYQGAVDYLAGTVDGEQALESLVRTGGMDPITTKTVDPVLPDEIGVFFPHVGGDTAALLTWMFEEQTTPIGKQMFNKLEEALSTHVGFEEGMKVMHLLNPMNRPFGSIKPTQWLSLHIERAGELMQRATRMQSSGTVQQFAKEFAVLFNEPQLADYVGVKVPLLAGSHDLPAMRGVLKALHTWRKWIDDTDIIPPQVSPVKNPKSKLVGEDFAGTIVRRKVSRAEHQAEPGFGRYYGSTSGHAFMRPDGTMNYEENPITVLIVGDRWGDTASVPTGWRQKVEDGIPVPNEWEPDASNKFMRTNLDKREWVEEEISNLARALMSLPKGSRVRYAAPSGKSAGSSYDVFGKVVDKAFKTVTEKKGATVRDLELAIWQGLGDFPQDKHGIEEAITTVLKKADDGSVLIKHPFGWEGTLQKGDHANARVAGVRVRAEKWAHDTKNGKAYNFLFRELRGIDNKTLAEAIVEFEFRHHSAIKFVPIKGFHSDQIVRDLKNVLANRPAVYKGGDNPSFISMSRLDDAWVNPNTKELLVENIPDEDLLSILMYGVGAHANKFYTQKIFGLTKKTASKRFDRLDQIAEELYMRGYNVYEETPRLMWYNYLDSRDPSLNLPLEISPHVRGFKNRGQRSLFDADDIPEGIRYTGPRPSVTPDEKMADLTGQLDGVREQIQIAEEERDMFRIMLEGTLDERPSPLEVDWDDSKLQALDQIRIEGYDLEVEALREAEFDVLIQIQELAKERRSYIEIASKEPERFKDIELLGKQGTQQFLDKTREGLFADTRATLTEELALLRKEYKEANSGRKYLNNDPDFIENLKDNKDIVEEYLHYKLQDNKKALDNLFEIGYLDDAEDVDYLDTAIYIAKTMRDEKDHFEEPWSALAKSISEERPEDWRAFSEARGYTEEQMAVFEKMMESTDEALARGYDEDDIWSLIYDFNEDHDLRDSLADLTPTHSLLDELEQVKKPFYMPEEIKELENKILEAEKRLSLDGTTPKRDFIGTIGGTKGSTGLRRIWPELDEDMRVPDLDLIAEPFASVEEIFPNALRYDEGVNQIPEADRLDVADVYDTWKGNFEPLYFGETMPTGYRGGRDRFWNRRGDERQATAGEGYVRDPDAPIPPQSKTVGGGEGFRGGKKGQKRESARFPLSQEIDPESGLSFPLKARKAEEVLDPEDAKMLRKEDIVGREGVRESEWHGPRWAKPKRKRRPAARGGLTRKDYERDFVDPGPTGANWSPTEGRAVPNDDPVEMIDSAQVNAFRNNQAGVMIINNEVDTVLPFYRNQTRLDVIPSRSEAPKEWAKLPAWLQGLDTRARKKGIPVSWDARQGKPSHTKKIVNSRLNKAYPDHLANESIWVPRVISDSGNQSPAVYGFSAGDVGGLDEADKFLSVHPSDLIGEQIDVMGHVDELPTTDLYMNEKGDYLWLREGQENLHPSFQNDMKITQISGKQTKASGIKNPLSNYWEHPKGLFFRGRLFKTAEGAYQAFRTGRYRSGFDNLTGNQARSRALSFEDLPMGTTIKAEWSVSGGGKVGSLPLHPKIKKEYKNNRIDAIMEGDITGHTVSFKHANRIEENDIIKLYGRGQKQLFVRVESKTPTSKMDPAGWAKIEGVDEQAARVNWKQNKIDKDKSINISRGHAQIKFKVVSVPANYPLAKGKTAEVAAKTPEFYTGLNKIVGGGQVGIHQAGLRVARAMGIETGGKAPKGWRVWDRASDAPANDPTTLKDFGLTESGSSKWEIRTEENVLGSQATLIWDPRVSTKHGTKESQLSGGTKLTLDFAKKHKRPYLINPSHDELALWLEEKRIKALNIAGPRLRTGQFANPLREEEEFEAFLRSVLTKIRDRNKKQVGDAVSDRDLLKEILSERWDQVPEFRKSLQNAGKFVFESENEWWREVYPDLLTDLRNEKVLDKEFIKIDSQVNGPVDKLNMAEHQATVLNTEAGRMFSTKNDEGATRVNYVGLLELQDQMPNDGMGNRLSLWNDGDLLPERMLARVPISAPPTKDERFQMVIRSFFDGAVQPIIAAMAREPMFTHYFADSLELTRGVRYFYNHEPQAFRFLRKRTDEVPNPPQYKRLTLDGESDVEQIKLGIHHGIDDTGVEQTSIPELDEFIINMRPQADGVLQGTPIGRVAQYLDDYTQGIRSKEGVLEELFKIQTWDELGPSLRQKTYALKDQGKQVDAMKKVIQGRAEPTGLFFEAFPQYREHFVDMWNRSQKFDDGRSYRTLTKQLVEYINLKSIQEREHVNLAVERAMWLTSEFIDDHSVRSLFQETVGLLLPFWFAEEQFLKRWVKTLETRPDAIRNLQASLLASQRSGLVYTDKNDQQRIILPESAVLGHVTEGLAHAPYLNKLFGKDGVGIINEDLSMSLANLVPGYNEQTGLPSFGPPAAIAIGAMSLLDPSLRGDGVWGWEDHMISRFGYDSKATDLMWSNVVPAPVAKLISGTLGYETPGYAGGRAKANLSVVEAMWAQGQFPDATSLADSSNPALLEESILQGIDHAGKQLQFLQNLTWWGGFTTATPKDMTAGGLWEWNEVFQSFMDSGLPHEVAFEKALGIYWKKFYIDSEAAGMTPDAITKEWWMSELPKFSIFQSGKSDKVSVARQPSTRAALDWMEDNKGFLEAFSLAGPFFIPAGDTEEDSEAVSEARKLQLSLGLRIEKTVPEYVESLLISSASIAYYSRKEDFDTKIAAARVAGDDKLKEGLEEEWGYWSDNFKAMHPTFEQSLLTQESKGRRSNTINQFHMVLNNPDLVPEDTPHREDIFMAMTAITEFDTKYQLLSGRQDGIASDQRNALKYDYNEWFKVAILNRPWLFPFYYNLFVPMIEEGWIIKMEAGMYPELTGAG